MKEADIILKLIEVISQLEVISDSLLFIVQMNIVCFLVLSIFLIGAVIWMVRKVRDLEKRVEQL